MFEILYEKDMKLTDMIIIPENDDWIYSKGYSRVCSALVVDILKHANIFGDAKITATEFTPKDLYEVNFWDMSSKNIPEVCKDHIEDNHCQIMGNVRFKLGEGNLVDPYDFMNHSCPTLSPHFERSHEC